VPLFPYKQTPSGRHHCLSIPTTELSGFQLHHASAWLVRSRIPNNARKRTICKVDSDMINHGKYSISKRYTVQIHRISYYSYSVSATKSQWWWGETHSAVFFFGANMKVRGHVTFRPNPRLPPPRKEIQCQFYRKLDWPQGRSGSFGENKDLQPGFEDALPARTSPKTDPDTSWQLP
jgi:hypothetical protein